MKIKPETIIEYGLLFLIIFTPLAFGSVHVWAYTIVEAVVLLLLLIWLCSRLAPNRLNVKSERLEVTPDSSRFTSHSSRTSSPADSSLLIAKSHDPRAKSHEHFSSHLVPRSSHLVPFALFLILILFQMVPLPAAVMKHLSPNTCALYRQTLGEGTERAPLIADSSSLVATRHEPSAMSPAPCPLPPAPCSLSIYKNATKTAFLKFFACGAVFFLIITTLTTARQLRRMALTIIFTGAGVAFLALCQMLSKSDKIYGFWQSQFKAGSYGGPFINPNHLAGYLELVIPLALGFLVSREVPGIIRSARNWKQRLSLLESWLAKNILLVFIIVLMGSAVFISGSRGGIISFVFSLGLFSLLLGTQTSRKGKRKLVLMISGLLLVFLLRMGIGPVVTELATLGDLKTASGERPRVWKDTLDLSRDFPVFGVGLGNFQTLFPKYKTIVPRSFYDHAHNDYLEMLADTGWAGLVLFFGGVWFLLFSIFRKWRKRRDPFPASITLGGLIGAVSLLCHSLVEFNLHIPANAFLLFVVLGLSMAAVHLKRREEEPSLLPIRVGFFPRKIKNAITLANALIVIFLFSLVMKDYLAYHFFMNYQKLSKELTTESREQGARSREQGAPRPMPYAPCSSPPALLLRAIFFDSGNARYHYELGNYYARKMSESWQQGSWTSEGEHWVFDAEKNTQFYGLKALQAYADAVNLSPASAWHHFYAGWILNELKRFSDFTHHPITFAEPYDAKTEFSRALMLDPNNIDIKNYVDAVSGRGQGAKT